LRDAIKLYVCGNSRFLHEIEELERKSKEKNIKCEISNEMGSRRILGCLKKIDGADIVYVVNPRGYVGKSVSVDLEYAYAKNKSILVMNHVDDPPIMNLTNGVLSIQALIKLLNENSL
jgi:hypothetical protein